MKQDVDRRKKKGKKYHKGDLVMLSTRDLKWQMKERRIKKLTKQFVDLYKIKRVILANAVKLKLPATIKIHPVVNASKV